MWSVRAHLRSTVLAPGSFASHSCYTDLLRLVTAAFVYTCFSCFPASSNLAVDVLETLSELAAETREVCRNDSIGGRRMERQ